MAEYAIRRIINLSEFVFMTELCLSLAADRMVLCQQRCPIVGFLSNIVNRFRSRNVSPDHAGLQRWQHIDNNEHFRAPILVPICSD